MKRLFLVLIIMMLGQPCAAGVLVNQKDLTISGTKISNLSLTNTVAATTDSIKVRGNTGFFVLYVTEDKAGGAGDVDIYAEYSIDGTTWGRAYPSNMAGSITQEGNIVTGLQNATRYIPFTARLAPFVRFIFDPDADSEITATVIYQEEY